MISFDVDDIAPVGKGRPRFTKRGHTYTPNKTAAFQKAFQALAKTHAPKNPLEGSLECEIWFIFKKPKRPVNRYPRGDIDNYAKAILDSLNGIMYKDDSQICTLKVTKRYSDHDRIHVTICTQVYV